MEVENGSYSLLKTTRKLDTTRRLKFEVKVGRSKGIFVPLGISWSEYTEKTLAEKDASPQANSGSAGIPDSESKRKRKVNCTGAVTAAVTGNLHWTGLQASVTI